VHSLGGIVRSQSGAILAFAFLANNTTADQDAQNWLDHETTVLAGV
jgi:D-alanyl-D-alanine carboxypeptidase